MIGNNGWLSAYSDGLTLTDAIMVMSRWKQYGRDVRWYLDDDGFIVGIGPRKEGV